MQQHKTWSEIAIRPDLPLCPGSEIPASDSSPSCPGNLKKKKKKAPFGRHFIEPHVLLKSTEAAWACLRKEAFRQRSSEHPFATVPGLVARPGGGGDLLLDLSGLSPVSHEHPLYGARNRFGAETVPLVACQLPWKCRANVF